MHLLALIGVGPNTVLDLVYHVALVALLVVGIGVAWRIAPEAAD